MKNKKKKKTVCEQLVANASNDLLFLPQFSYGLQDF